MAKENPNESVEKQKKYSFSSEKNRFLNKFSNEAFSSDSEYNEFIKNLSNAKSLSDFGINKLLEDFKNKHNKDYNNLKTAGTKATEDDKYRKFDLDINKISINDLKKEFASDIVSLKSRRNNLLDFIDVNFDLTKEQLISLEIEKLNSKQLSDLLEKNENLQEFLKTKLKLKNLLKIEKPNLFNELYAFLSDEKIEEIAKLNGVEKEKVEKIVNKIKLISPDTGKKGSYQIEALKELFSLKGLDKDLKKKLLKRYLPNVNLSDVKDLLGEHSYNKLKRNIIVSLFGDNISKEEKKSLLKGLDDKVSFNIDLLFDIDSNIGEKILNKEELKYRLASKLVDNFNRTINEGEKSINDEIGSISGLQEELGKLGVEDVEKLKEGSILKITKITKNVYVENYLRIDKIDEKTKQIKFSLIGVKNGQEQKTIISSKSTEFINKSFAELKSLLESNNKSKKISFTLFDSNEFKELIKDEDNFDVKYESLDSIKVKDIKDDKELQEKVRDDLTKKYNEELENLEENLSNILEQLDSLKKGEGDYSNLSPDELKSKEEVLNIKKSNLEKLIEDKRNEINFLGDDNLDLEILVVHNNFNDLVNKLDKLDSDGKKLGLQKGIEIEYKDKTGNYISFEIVGINKEIDDQTIVLKNVRAGNEEIISYEAFYQAFKNNKAKRVEKINNFEHLLEVQNNDEKWKNYKIENGKLIAKEVEYNNEKGKNVKEDKKIDYLVSEDGELIKIEELGNGFVEVVFGELKTDVKKTDKGKKKLEETIHNITLEKSTTKLSYNELNKLIEENKYTPDWQIGKEYKSLSPNEKNNEFNGSFSTRFWNRVSIKELVQGGKMLVDGIMESMKRGNDVRAAQFALGIAKILPTEIYEDFETQVEMNQAEAMEKALTALGKIDSGKATGRVLKWLKNKDTPEYKKEAGLMYMAKYGVLYAKKLAPYKGKYLWYEALGGVIGDELYLEEKKKAENGEPPKPFDEKELIIALLKRQSNGVLKPKRRSKFHKEFKGKISSGFNSENNDGYEDAKDKRSIAEINDGGMGEVIGGTVPNGLAWAKRAVEKGGSLKEMNKIYFTLIYSGALYDAPSNVLEKQLKTDWQSGNSMIFAAFGSTLGGQKLLNKTVRDLAKEIERIEPGKYKGIASLAQEIYDKAFDSSISHDKKVKLTEQLWEKYGDVLSRSLHLVDDDKIEYNKTDKIIPFGKDGKFKDYYHTVKEITEDSFVFGKGFMEDAVGASGVADTNVYKVLEHHFGIDQTLTFRNKSVVEIVWPKILSGLKTVPQKLKDDPDNEEKYRKFLDKKLREIVAGMLSGAGKDRVGALDTVDPVGYDLASYGIVLSSFAGIRIDDILDGNVKKDVFDKAVDNIINGNTLEIGDLGNIKVFDDDIQSEDIKDRIEETKDYVTDLS